MPNWLLHRRQQRGGWQMPILRFWNLTKLYQSMKGFTEKGVPPPPKWPLTEKRNPEICQVRTKTLMALPPCERLMFMYFKKKILKMVEKYFRRSVFLPSPFEWNRLQFFTLKVSAFKIFNTCYVSILSCLYV